jgi:hypothetical protein
MANYKVLVGVDYAGKRAEPGDIVTDLPAKSVPWLLEQGVIESVDKTATNTREPQSPTEGDE